MLLHISVCVNVHVTMQAVHAMCPNAGVKLGWSETQISSVSHSFTAITTLTLLAAYSHCLQLTKQL